MPRSALLKWEAANFFARHASACGESSSTCDEVGSFSASSEMRGGIYTSPPTLPSFKFQQFQRLLPEETFPNTNPVRSDCFHFPSAMIFIFPKPKRFDFPFQKSVRLYRHIPHEVHPVALLDEFIQGFRDVKKGLENRYT